MLSSPAISATAQINHTYNASKRRKGIRTKLITIFYMQLEKGKAWMMNPVNCFSLIPHCLCHLKCTGLFHAAGTAKTGRVWKWEPVLLTACAKRQVRNNTCHLVPTLLTDSVNLELCLEPCFLWFHLRNYLISPSLGSRLNCWNIPPRKVSKPRFWILASSYFFSFRDPLRSLSWTSEPPASRPHSKQRRKHPLHRTFYPVLPES